MLHVSMQTVVDETLFNLKFAKHCHGGYGGLFGFLRSIAALLRTMYLYSSHGVLQNRLLCYTKVEKANLAKVVLKSEKISGCWN